MNCWKKVVKLFKMITYNNHCQLFASHRYKVTDLTGERQYLLDLKLKACFDATQPCQLIVNILSNYIVTKPRCAWYTGFVQTGKQKHSFDINKKKTI